MRLNTTLGRLALIGAAFLAVAAAVSVGGRAYLNHLSDPPATSDPDAAVSEPEHLWEPDEVGTCYDLVADTRDGAADGAQHWQVVHCSTPHTAEVVAVIDLADVDVDANPSEWGAGELGAATQACADARHAAAETRGSDLAGEDATITATVRSDQLMCVATSTPHRHLDGDRVEVDGD